MKYTIDIYKIIYTTHRLKKDGTFKPFKLSHEKELEEDDYTFDSYANAKIWLDNQDYVEASGEKIPVNPSSYGIADPSVRIRPHRTGKPKQKVFSKEQLKEVLLNGDDRINNSLIVNNDGFLKLVPFSQVRNISYAVRFETFDSGNGYVGKGASLYNLDEIYLSLLDAWAIHLVSHDRIYKDHPSNQTEEELLKEIDEAYNAL
nr:hypothetical protein [Heyndrickxia oleronia]